MSAIPVQANSWTDRLRTTISNNPMLRYPDLGLICLGVFIMLIGVGAIVPVRAIYARDLGATAAELGLMASSFLLGNFMFQLPGGWLSDKWGRKPLLVFGIAVAGIISFAFLLWDHPWYFIALRFVEGAAGGAIQPASNAYVMDAVPARERGAAFGWLGSAFSAGFMLGPAAGGIMVDTMGYASPFIFGGVTSIATALFLLKWMHNRRPGERPAVAETSTGVAGEGAEAPARKQIPRKLFRPALFSTLLMIAASGIEDGLFIALWTLWLDDLGASTSYIGLTFITFSLPLMVLMPITGKWADKYRLAPIIAIPAALASLVYLTYALTDSLFLIAALGLFEGTLVAMRIPAISAFIANLSPDNARGRIQGITSTTRTIAGFVSSMVVIMLYEINHHFPFLMLFGTQLVVSVVAGILIWRIERRSIEANRVAEVVEVAPVVQLHTAGAGLDTAAK
ncbi:MAG: MFS transporter [Chloroflexota bacterium]|nr:MFS transporter [Chloroflexota bacterium]